VEGPVKNRIPSDRRRSDGMALLVTVFVLLLVGAVAVAAIHHSGEEFAAGGRTRATMRNLYAADSGIQLALTRISTDPPDLSPLNFSVGPGRSVRSGVRTDASPQPLVPAGFGPPPEGNSINIGAGFSNELFLVTVTASAASGGIAELESKLGRFIAGSGGP
jgi:hypothetical protein